MSLQLNRINFLSRLRKKTALYSYSELLLLVLFCESVWLGPRPESDRICADSHSRQDFGEGSRQSCPSGTGTGRIKPEITTRDIHQDQASSSCINATKLLDKIKVVK